MSEARRLQDCDPAGFAALEAALNDAYLFDRLEDISSRPEVSLSAPKGLLFGLPIEAGGEAAVFYADEDEMMGSDRAIPVVDKVAVGRRITSDGWRRGLYTEPVLSLELTREDGSDLSPPDYAAVGIGSASLHQLVVYQADDLPSDLLDPYDYITRDSESTAA